MTDENCIFPIQSENINIQSTRKPLQVFCNMPAEMPYHSIHFVGYENKEGKTHVQKDVIKCQRYVRLYNIIRSEWGTGCLPTKIKMPGMETPSACLNLAKTGWVFSVNCKVYSNHQLSQAGLTIGNERIAR